MRFLRSRSTTPAAVPAEHPAALDSLVIFGLDGVTEAWIERTPVRISDRLNQGDTIAVHAAPGDAGVPLAIDDVVAVVVQPQPNPSPNRMARRRHVLEMLAPPYRIVGTVHMPPGADPVRYLRAVPHRWVAVTNATILEEDGSGYSAEVVLVHLEHVSRM